ncbi:MAG: cupin domain-containing protein [Deltaproteobacteria bacterium]|nr:cupin domain-containing protein [Deltaproteobacteria bacterium]
MMMKREKETQATGERLAEIRRKKKMSLEELSEKTGLTVSHLTSIEEGKDFAPVGDILKISRALTVNPEELFSADAKEEDLKKKRVAGFKKREESYQYTVLTPQGTDKHLRAFRVVIPAKSEHPKISYRHEGEEFVYVLEGEVKIRVGRKSHHLKVGDAFHFDSGISHSLVNPGGKPTVLIVTLYTP